MNQFQKNVSFVTLMISIVGGGSFAVNYAMQEHKRHLEEERVQLEEYRVDWRKANVAALKQLSAIGTLSTEEQIRLDNAGDDFERLRQVLLDIHVERGTYWESKVRELDNRKRELQDRYSSSSYVSFVENPDYLQAAANISQQEKEAAENLSGYQVSRARLRDWVPVSFPGYCAQRKNTHNAVSTDSNETSNPLSTSSKVIISEQLAQWAAYYESNDLDGIMGGYAESVDRYFRVRRVSREFIRNDKQAFFSKGNRFRSFRMHDITLERSGENNATVVLRKSWSVENRNGQVTEATTRSRLWLANGPKGWKIDGEQDLL